MGRSELKSVQEELCVAPIVNDHKQTKVARNKTSGLTGAEANKPTAPRCQRDNATVGAVDSSSNTPTARPAVRNASRAEAGRQTGR